MRRSLPWARVALRTCKFLGELKQARGEMEDDKKKQPEKVEEADKDNEDVLVIDTDDGRAEVVLADRGGRSRRKGDTSVVRCGSKSR